MFKGIFRGSAVQVGREIQKSAGPKGKTLSPAKTLTRQSHRQIKVQAAAGTADGVGGNAPRHGRRQSEIKKPSR
jgi:hypothetical protein